MPCLGDSVYTVWVTRCTIFRGLCVLCLSDSVYHVWVTSACAWVTQGNRLSTFNLCIKQHTGPGGWSVGYQVGIVGRSSPGRVPCDGVGSLGPVWIGSLDHIAGGG